jgi:hypothetical protein
VLGGAGSIAEAEVTVNRVAGDVRHKPPLDSAARAAYEGCLHAMRLSHPDFTEIVVSSPMWRREARGHADAAAQILL